MTLSETQLCTRIKTPLNILKQALCHDHGYKGFFWCNSSWVTQKSAHSHKP